MDPDDSDYNLVIYNAGLVQLNIARLGNFTFIDDDGDGIQDRTEKGLEGVRVTLFVFPDGEVEAREVGSVVSKEDGFYEFTAVELVGDFYLEFTPPPGYIFTQVDQGFNDEVDSDPDRVTGTTAVFQLSAGQDNSQWDAGFVPGGVAETNPDPTPTVFDPTVKSGWTISPEGFTITWMIRQAEGALQINYMAVNADGVPVSGTAYGTVALGDPGGDSLGGHANGPFDADGNAQLAPPIHHLPDTELGVWVFFEGLDAAIKLTDTVVAVTP
jgi:hypothetical protein